VGVSIQLYRLPPADGNNVDFAALIRHKRGGGMALSRLDRLSRRRAQMSGFDQAVTSEQRCLMQTLTRLFTRPSSSASSAGGSPGSVV
jgi:hypothetical protein